MKKQRVSTTISQKHMELLKKYSVKYETHQRVLEIALESLDRIESMKNSSKSSKALTMEEECWLRAYSTKSMCLISKDSFQLLMKTADIEQSKEYITQTNSIAYALEYYMMKPIIECSLKEIIDTLVITLRAGNAFDTIDCMEDGSHYKLIFTHILGLNASKILSMSYERIFESCGVKAESVISEKTIFMTIFKSR